MQISTSSKWRYKLPFCVEPKKFNELSSTNHEVVFAYFDLPKIDSAYIFGKLSILSTNISGMNQDIDKQ